MQRKHLTALFLLTVFLLPLVGQLVHSSNHIDDEHCEEREVTHFHKTGHQCSLCDYVRSTSFISTVDNSLKKIIRITTEKVGIYDAFIKDQLTYCNSQRGPPIAFIF